LEEAQKAERALADFAVNLYKNISAQQEREDKNEIVSPISVALALALLEAGADGNTRHQLQQQLTENGATDDVLSVYRALEQQLRIQDEHTRLQIANGVFHDKQVHLKQEYQQAAQQCLDAQIQEEDFEHQLEQTRQHINKFIADKTENKIPELFKKDSLRENNKIVLANAVYLKAAWQHAFNKQQTKQQPFYRQGRQQDPQNVLFMQADGQYRHSQDEQMQVVEMKYEKEQLSMYVLLPKQRDGLKQLEQQLSGDRLRSIMRQLQNKQVHIQMPKFSARSPHDLKQSLSRMGLSNLFTSPDLSRLSEEKLRIGQAIHEAYIKIDEQGTEAAAATGIAIEKANAVFNDEPTQFVADHPFLYAIVHNPTGAVVFIGKVTEVQSDQ
jgi:serpin B